MGGVGRVGVVLAAALALPGCGSYPLASDGGKTVLAAGPVAGAGYGDPFAPASISIFPLTQLQLDDAGEPWLLLFVELQDRWGDPVKATGWLTVFLEPESPRVDRTEHEARWDVDLTEASVNSALFDPVTRTYRMQLGGLPGRAAPMAERSELRRGGGDPQGQRSMLRLRAMFRTLDSDGKRQELWSTFELES